MWLTVEWQKEKIRKDFSGILPGKAQVSFRNDKWTCFSGSLQIRSWGRILGKHCAGLCILYIVFLEI